MRTAPTLFAGIILCALVWYFAIVGLLTVMAAPVGEARPSVTPLLPMAEVEGRDIVDISAYPSALRTEYRRTPVGDLTHVEIEYLTDASLADVRAFYRTQLVRHGWTVVHAYLDRGESAYVIVKEPRIGRVRLEAIAGMVEIEIEVDQPAARRGSTTDR